MLGCALMGTPKYLDRYVGTPALITASTLVHPCPGAVTWFVTNPIAGAVSGDTFTPAGGFYGVGHIVGRVGDVRGMVNIWVVPDDIPRSTYFLPHVKLHPTDQNYHDDRYITPRPGAHKWTESIAETTLGWDDSLWMTPIRQTITVTPDLGLMTLTGSVTGGVYPHSWFVLERVPSTASYIDRTAACTISSGGTDDTVVFDVPGITANYTLMATNAWDCWILPPPE